MDTTSARECALYLYGIVRSCDAVDLGPIGIEAGGKPERVYPLAIDDVAAVVSRCPARARVLPIRKNLDAQSSVLRQLLNSPGGVLPFRFGHVVPDEAEVRRILATHRQDIAGELAGVAGRVELALKIFWDVENIFDHLLRQDPALSAERERLFAGGRQPSRDECIDLGRRFAARIDEERQAHGRQVLEALDDVVVDTREDPAVGEKMVLNLAILAERCRLVELEERVQEVAGRFPDTLLFKYSGPFAPFHFVTLNIAEEMGAGGRR